MLFGIQREGIDEAVRHQCKQENTEQPRGRQKERGQEGLVTCEVTNLAENGCGVKRHSSEIGDKAVNLSVL